MIRHERDVRLRSLAGTSEQTPEEIEHEIAFTRERMSNDLDALGEKLRPSNLRRQAREAITDKAQSVVAGLGDQARETGDRIVGFGSSHRLPVAAASLGAAWLFSRTRARIPVALAAGAVLAGLALDLLLPHAAAEPPAGG